MRTITILISLLLFCDSGIASVDVGAEFFSQFRIQSSNVSKTYGFDVNRLRIFLEKEISADWRFASAIDLFAESETASSASDMPQIRRAAIFGKKILFSEDQVGLGAQGHPILLFFYPTLGTRWISKVVGHGPMFTAWSTGVSYRTALIDNLINSTFFVSSAESASLIDSDDRKQEYSAFFTLSSIEGLKSMFGYGRISSDVGGGNSIDRYSLSLTYVKSWFRLGLEYYLKDEKLGRNARLALLPEPSIQRSLGVESLWNLSDKLDLYVHYFGGYEATSTNESESRIGLATKIKNKIDLGLFYEHKIFKQTDRTPRKKDEYAFIIRLATNV